MSHWAEIDKNNIVVRVTVGDNNDPAGDEGYQWLIDNLGGTWIKTSYNTVDGVHALGGTPIRNKFAAVGDIYDYTFGSEINKEWVGHNCPIRPADVSTSQPL